jgi:hypothetical protein
MIVNKEVSIFKLEEFLMFGLINAGSGEEGVSHTYEF